MTSDAAGTRRFTVGAVLGACGAVVIAGAGLALSRPDVVAVSLPLALWAALALTTPDSARRIRLDVRAAPDEGGRMRSEIEVDADADAVQLVVTQAARRTTTVVAPGKATIVSRSLSRHSGPVDALRVRVREIDADGAVVTAWGAPAVHVRAVEPVRTRIAVLPLAPRLTGLHGAHDGSRPGRGGDFRDIQQFRPGDEVRRIDWRATARAARRPGELLVRRTHALSDASVVIAMETSDDLGEVVRTWGSVDLERSGTTSLDHTRAAALSLATASIESGDRVALHTLTRPARSLRSASGPRHLARIASVIASTSRDEAEPVRSRTLPVPPGSMVYVLSTFMGDAAAEQALRWRASGHRVVAVDTLPALDRARLTREQLTALRIVLAERDDVFRELRGAGIDLIEWRSDPAERLAVIARAGGGAR